MFGDNKMTTFKRDFNIISKKEMKKIISLNIKKYRKIAGITQEQLAVDIDKSYDFVRRLEFTKGKVGCSTYTLYCISKVLNTSIENFFK